MPKLCVTILSLLISGLASAVSVQSSGLEVAVYQADAIAHVRVTEGRALFFQQDVFGRVQPCAGVYKAEVLNLLKGEIRQTEFGINFNLMLTPGNEYLLFFDDRGGLGIESIMFEPADYQQCREGLPSWMARWRSSSLVEWELTEDSGWVQMVTAPYGIFIEEPPMNDEAKLVLEEYLERIEGVVADQAKNGLRRNPSEP